MKRIVLLALFLAAASSMLCSCASVPLQSGTNERLSKRFEPTGEPGWCDLYVFRDGHVGSALVRKVYVDGQYAGKTGYKTFLHRLVRPGEHWVQTETSATGAPRELRVEAREGEPLFVRQKLSLSGKIVDDPRTWNGTVGDMVFGETWLAESARSDAVAAIAGLRLAADGDGSEPDLPDAKRGECRGSRPAHGPEPAIGPVPPPPVLPPPDSAQPVGHGDGDEGGDEAHVVSKDELAKAEEEAYKEVLGMMASGDSENGGDEP